MLIMVRPVYEGTDLLIQIRNETERLKVLIHTSFNHATDSFKLTETMNSYYEKLVQLTDDLWEKARLPNHTARLAMTEVLALKHFLEKEYGSFLDMQRALTDFERFTLEHRVLTEIQLIKEHFCSKKISEPLILQLEKVFLDLFKASKYPRFSVSKKEYVEALLMNLLAMAIDQRDKNWNVRLRQLLIKFNCNHMGIYRLLEAEHEREIILIRDPEMQQDQLYAKEIWIEQIQMNSRTAYNRDANDLKSMLLKHIKALGPHLAKKNKLRKAEKPEKVKYKLSVDELSLIFHYHCEEGIYDYLSKRAAAEAFCEHNRSIGTENMSTKSFLKLDKLEYRTAALNYYKRNSRILKQVKNDFDL